MAQSVDPTQPREAWLFKSRSSDEASVRGLHQGQQSGWAASKGRTHDCKRPMCCTPNYLLPGGGHPHMRSRLFLVLSWILAGLALLVLLFGWPFTIWRAVESGYPFAPAF